MELSPKLQNQLAQYQQLQNQTQLMMAQKQQVELQVREVEKSIEELEKVDEGTTIYRSIGSILVKAEGKEPVMNELKEKKETLDVRLKTLDRQVENLRQKLQALQRQLAEAINAQGN